jgi:hypothetical protein
MNLLIFDFNVKSLGELSSLFFRRFFNVWVQPLSDMTPFMQINSKNID